MTTCAGFLTSSGFAHGAARFFDSARRQNLPKKRRPWSGIEDYTCQMTLAVDLPQVTLTDIGVTTCFQHLLQVYGLGPSVSEVRNLT